MKNLLISGLLLLVLSISSCQIVGGIFKAGAFVGILAVVIVIVVLLGIISMFRKK
ncbi:phosphatidate cytidylyltransferase [Taibaiella lutea]|uniref:Phosphatidate cytidylyltransferase n=1 Tax=Taibaiella lutea TaxID=2608001 RepID=A0A5M6CAE8_9BACT|nr:phosphatidate cytidylyltransferase [Taibaiella lutea]KAA5532138.1 phosphatidate cytidylyltransferase [Taibaiella lutea]